MENLPLDMKQLFFNNMKLLGFDAHAMEAANHIPFNRTMFDLPNRRGAEIVLHFLFQRLNPTMCKEYFRDCWPVLDKKREQAFRKTCYTWLTNIAQEEQESRLPRINASLFMSPGGDKFYQLLFHFSGFVREKVMENELGSKGHEGLRYPSLTSQNLPLGEVMLKDLACSSVRHRRGYFNTVQLTLQANNTWQQTVNEYVKDYRKLSKDIRELDYKIRAEEQKAIEASVARGSPVKRHGQPDHIDPDFDPGTIKRAQRVQQVREMWQQLADFERTESAEREVVESIVERTINKHRLDAADISIKVPDMLLRECGEEIRRRNVDNTYQGGKLNLVSVLQLWNLCLHLYLEKIHQVGVAKFDEDLALLKSQLHVQQSYRQNAVTLRHQMAESIPALKTSIQKLREKLDNVLFQDQSPESIRTTVSDPSLSRRAPPTHTEQPSSRKSQKRQKWTCDDSRDRCVFLQRLCEMEAGADQHDEVEHTERECSSKELKSENLKNKVKKKSLKSKDKHKKNKYSKDKYKSANMSDCSGSLKADESDLKSDTGDISIGPAQIDEFEKALEASGLHPNSLDSSSCFPLNTSDHTQTNSSGYHSKTVETPRDSHFEMENQTQSSQERDASLQSSVLSQHSDLGCSALSKSIPLPGTDRNMSARPQTHCVYCRSCLPEDQKCSQCDSESSHDGSLVGRSDSAVVVTCLEDSTFDVSVVRHIEKSGPTSEEILISPRILSSNLGICIEGTKTRDKPCTVSSDSEDSDSSINISMTKYVQQGTEGKSKVIYYRRLDTRSPTMDNIDLSPVQHTSQTYLAPKDMFADTDQVDQLGRSSPSQFKSSCADTNQVYKSDLSSSSHQSGVSTSRLQSDISSLRHQSDIGSSRLQSDVSTSRLQSDISSLRHQSDIGSSRLQSDVSSTRHQSDIGSARHQSNVSSSRLQSAISSLRHQSDISSSSYQSEVSSVKHKSDISSSWPKFDISSLKHQFEVGSARHESEFSSVRPKSDIIPSRPNSDISSLKHQLEVSSLGHQSNGSSLRPKSDISSPWPKTDISSLKDQFEVSSTRHQSDVSSSRHQSDISSLKHQFDVSSTRDQFDVSSHRPQSDVSSVKPKSDISYARPKTDISSLKHQFEVSSTRHKSDDSSVRPQSDIGSLKQKFDIDSSSQQSNISSLKDQFEDSSTRHRSFKHQFDVSFTRYQSDVSSLRPQSDVSSVKLKSDISSARPKSDISSSRPKSDICSYSHQSDSSFLKHQFDVRSPMHQPDVSSTKHQLDGSFTRPKSDISSTMHQSDISSVRHQSVISSVRPKSDISFVMHQSDNSSTMHQSDISSVRHQSVISSVRPKSDISFVMHQSDNSSTMHQSDISSVRHQSVNSSVRPKSDISSVMHQSDISSVMHQSDISSVMHQSEISSTRHQSVISSVRPKSDVTSSRDQSAVSSSWHHSDIGSSTHQSPRLPSDISSHMLPSDISSPRLPSDISSPRLPSDISSASHLYDISSASHQSDISSASHQSVIGSSTQQSDISFHRLQSDIIASRHGSDINTPRNKSDISSTRHQSDISSLGQQADISSPRLPSDISSQRLQSDISSLRHQSDTSFPQQYRGSQLNTSQGFSTSHLDQEYSPLKDMSQSLVSHSIKSRLSSIDKTKISEIPETNANTELSSSDDKALSHTAHDRHESGLSNTTLTYLDDQVDVTGRERLLEGIPKCRPEGLSETRHDVGRTCDESRERESKGDVISRDVSEISEDLDEQLKISRDKHLEEGDFMLHSSKNVGHEGSILKDSPRNKKRSEARVEHKQTGSARECTPKKVRFREPSPSAWDP